MTKVNEIDITKAEFLLSYNKLGRPTSTIVVGVVELARLVSYIEMTAGIRLLAVEARIKEVNEQEKGE